MTPANRHEITFALNGEEVTQSVRPNRTLVEFLREDQQLRGTTEGCGVGVCGCCTVLVDGEPVSSCIELAVNVDGSSVRTVEGLADLTQDEDLHPLQEAFQDHEGFQCGYCTPGMLMSSYALLADDPNPSDTEIKAHLSENLCRCTGYKSIIRSVRAAAENLPDA